MTKETKLFTIALIYNLLYLVYIQRTCINWYIVSYMFFIIILSIPDIVKNYSLQKLFKNRTDVCLWTKMHRHSRKNLKLQTLPVLRFCFVWFFEKFEEICLGKFRGVFHRRHLHTEENSKSSPIFNRIRPMALRVSHCNFLVSSQDSICTLYYRTDDGLQE